MIVAGPRGVIAGPMLTLSAQAAPVAFVVEWLRVTSPRRWAGRSRETAAGRIYRRQPA
jgi:hypothetical protein